MRCPDDETLASFAAGTLPPAERLAVADHAASCEHCHPVVAEIVTGVPADVETVDEEDAGPRDQALDVELIDRYQIRSRLGMGGMGIVYAARDPELGRDVAIKLLRARAPEARLRREAQALARLSHPNVVSVYDVGTHHGQIFVAMALVDGVDLRRWLETPRSTAEILRVLIDAGRGLAAAHAVGLIHRDLKPDNIFVSRAGRALIGDFGLARDVEAAEGADAPVEASPAPPPLDATAGLLGTPGYMAPEQASGAATMASDQYGFCVTAWEALYGARPYPGRTLEQILEAVRAGAIARPPDDRRVPARVHRALVRGLAAAPADRHPSLDALLRQLAPPARRWPLVALVAVVPVAIAVPVAIMLAQPDAVERCRPVEQKLAGVWDGARRDAVGARLGGVLDPESATSALAAVDAYAARWSAGWRDACVATEQSTTMFDLRIACLERQRAGLDAAGGALVTADAEGAREAFTLIGGLEAPELCGDVATLSRVTPPRSDQRREVERIDAAAARAAVTVTARGDEAATVIAAALADARRLGYPPLIARTLIVAAKVTGFRKDMATATDQLRDATAVALSAGDDATLATALLQLARTLSFTGQLDETERQLELAAAVVTRVGGGRFVHEVEEIRANVAAVRGQFDQALAHADAALAAFRASGLDDGQTESELVALRAGALTLVGRSREAVADYERALALTIRLAGTRNPMTALAEFDLGSARLDAGTLTEDAIGMVERAHASLVASLGPSTYNTAYVGLRLVKLRIELDDLDAAEPLAAQVAATFAATAGPAAGRTFDARLQVATIALRRGQLAAADRELDAIATEMIAARGADNVGLADVLITVGELRLAQGRPADALVAFDRTGELLVAAVGADSSLMAAVWIGRGQVALARGTPQPAVEAFRTAARLGARGVREAAVLGLGLAEALWRTGDRPGARAAAAAALAGLDQLSPTADPPMRARVAAWQAAHPAR